jgi:hypothetical protein
MDNAAWRLWTARNIGVALANDADGKTILRAMIDGANEALRLLDAYAPGIAPPKDGEHA